MAVAAVTAVPVTPMTALGVPVPPGTILSANDNNNNINNNTQPVAAVPSSQAVTSQAVPISAVAVAAVTAVPVTPMTALGVPVPPGTILSANDNNNNINNNTQPVAAVPSSQQFTADELKGCWFGRCVSPQEVRASALRNRPDALAHLFHRADPLPLHCSTRSG